MSLILIKKDILDIEHGVIAQQVNCQNAYGRGISGSIAKKYPEVAEYYHSKFDYLSSEEVFGLVQFIAINRRLIVTNIFSQFNYGNAYKTHIQYTDMNALVDGILEARKYGANLGEYLYIPYRIGCGLAGGNWDELCSKLNSALGSNIIYVCVRPQDITEGVEISNEEIDPTNYRERSDGPYRV